MTGTRIYLRWRAVLFVCLALFSGIAAADDHGNSFATATDISVGGISTGVIEVPGDEDFFRLTVPSSGYHWIYSRGKPGFRIWLYDSSYNNIIGTANPGSGENGDSLLMLNLSAGTYYLKVFGGTSNTTGPYNFYIEGPGAPIITDDHGSSIWSATPITVGGITTGTINQTQDEDFFRLTVPSSGYHWIYSRGKPGFRIWLYDSSYNNIIGTANPGSGENGDSLLMLNLSAGTYYLKVFGGTSNTTGPYNFYIEGPGAPIITDDHGSSPWSATGISGSCYVSGVLGVPGDRDYFRFSVPVAASYVFYTTGSTDTSATLYDSTIQSIASAYTGGAGANFRMIRTLNPGTYYLEVSGGSSLSTGPYALYGEAAGQAATTPCQIPAEQTPPERVDLSVDSSVALTSGTKAVVITHGWGADVSTWVAEMSGKYCARTGVLVSTTSPAALPVDALTKMCQVRAPDNVLWDVWIMDWRTKAGIGGPWNAFTNATERGRALANNLKVKNYSHIHLIAHSAGSNLIDFATLWLKTWATTESRPPIAIHATFLDAYHPVFDPSQYGKKADWTDNYVDTREVGDAFSLGGFDGTKLFLDKAYNVDVTPLAFPDPCAQLYDVNDPQTIKKVWGCRHNRPYRFYGLSVSSSFVGDAASAAADPIPPNGTGAMGYPLSVENGRLLSALNSAYPKGAKCVMSGGICSPGSLPPSALFFLPGAVAGTVVDTVTGAVSYVVGAGTTLLNSVRLGGISPLSGFSIGTRNALSATATDSPSWIVVLPTTTQPVNTLRFNWRFAAAGEGFLRVYVNGELVREIDQRHVSIASVTAEEIYIGGAGGTLAPGTHRIAFRLDGFGSSTSGVELTGVDLGLTALNAPLDVDASLSATKYDASTDGLLTLRYLFGLTGTSLTNGVLGGTASRTDPALIKARLDGLRTSLDIDGNGRADALTDGLLILRYMFGLRGASLIAGAVDPLGTRKTATDIETYIQSLMP